MPRLRIALIVTLVLAATPSSAAEGWSRVSTPNGIEGQHTFVQGLDCVAPDDCWAVGYHYSPTGQKTLAMRWDGEAWSLVPTPTPAGHTFATVWGAGCAAADRCWAVGFSYDGLDYAPLILGWDGIEWTLSEAADSPTPGSDFLYDVACAGPGDCWAVGRHQPGALGGGNAGRAMIQRWDGTSWSLAEAPMPLAQSSTLNAVTCAGPDDCWAVGSATGPGPSRTLAARWDGEAWRVVASPSTSPEQANALNDVTCVSSNECWAVGIFTGQQNQALALRWDGASWSLEPIPSKGPDLATVVTGVACVASDECYAVGYQREGTWLVTLIERWDGERWEIVPSPNSAYGQTNILWPVDCVEGDCWTAGHYYGAGNVARTQALFRPGEPPGPSVPAPAPVVVDPAGDANAVNGQGFGQEIDQPTDPASIASADLVGVWLETTYDTVIERDEQGDVRFVRHVPTGLRMRLRTAGPAKPTFGPTVTYRVPVTVGAGCQAWLSIYVRGDAPGSLDRAGAEILRQTGCGATTIPSGASLTFDGAHTIATFPLATSGNLLADGTEIGPWSRPSVRVAAGNGTQQLFTAPAIDETGPVSGFTIGSDVPPNIDCHQTPSDPACRG